MGYYCHWPLLPPLLLLFVLFSQRQFVVVQGHLASSSEELSATEMSTADADSAASSEIVDVLIVNPTFSSFNNESPKRVGGANRRELLLRQIHQKQHQQFAPSFSSASSLTKQRTLRPYFLPVPKAKAIPGPILAKTVGNDKLLVKGTKLLARMDFVNAQSTAGLGAEQGRIKLVNGGGDEENRRMDGEEEEERRTTPPMKMHSNEVGQQQNEGRNGRTLLGGWALKTRIRPKQREEPAFSTSLDEQPEQQQKSSSRISSAPIQAKIFGQTQKLSRPILAKTQTFDVGPNKIGRIRQHLSTVPLHQSAHSQLQNPLPPSSPPPSQQFHFYFSPSQTTVNQDFTFAPGTPGIVCAYGMPIPIYNTPRKQCIPYSPLCGLAFTCLMDVHAVDQKGQIVENWWTLPGADQIIRQSRENAFGALIGSSSSGGGGGTSPAIGHFGGFPTAINTANRGEWIG